MQSEMIQTLTLEAMFFLILLQTFHCHLANVDLNIAQISLC